MIAWRLPDPRRAIGLAGRPRTQKTRQARRKAPRGGDDGCARCRRRIIARHRCGVVHRLAGKANETLRRGKFLILVAQALEFQSQRLAGQGCEPAADRRPEGTAGKRRRCTGGARHHVFQHALEDACNCLPDRRRHGRADAASYSANKLAKKLLEFLLVPGREQFGRQIHLAGFAEDLTPCVWRGDAISCECFQLRVVLGEGTEHRDLGPE